MAIETSPTAGESEGRSPAGVLTPAPPALPEQGTAVQGSENEASLPFGPTTGVAHPIPIPKKQAEWESGYQAEHGPRPSRWESWVSTPIEESAHATIASPWGGALLRMMQEAEGKSGKMLQADEANKLYPGRPVPYTTPVDQAVAVMEYNDRQKQQEMADWAAQRPMTTMGRVVSTASGFVGGLTDPFNFAVGALSGGVAELVAPEAAPLAMKAITHYLANLGGFTATESLQNLLEHQMGAKRKQLPEIVGETAVPAAIMTGVGMGLGALARRFSNEGGGTSEADIRAIRKNVEAFERDQGPPMLEEQSNVFSERKAGVRQTPSGEKIRPTILTSPLQETPLYAATHSDGSPLVHEHGLGPGVQFTDQYDVANNGVSRSTETPGHLAETRLPENSKLLDLDNSALADYASEGGILKRLEERIGVSLDTSVANGESLKEVITNLGDWAGVYAGEGRTIPENVLKQIQEIAQERGFNGYEFLNNARNARQVHVFDPSTMSVEKSYLSDPKTTPQIQEPSTVRPQVEGQPVAPVENPALDRAQSKFYSPEIERLAREFRKGKTFDPYSPEEIANIQKEVDGYKQQLADFSKTSETAREALEDLRAQDVQDARLRDIAKRIADCGSGGGI